MLKNRVFLALGVFSVLLVTMAVSRPVLDASLDAEPAASHLYQHFYQRDTEDFRYGGANDLYKHFYQRDTDWAPTRSDLNSEISVTGGSEYSDYYHRHLNSGVPTKSNDLSD
jgi:hypothetical protein